MSVFYDCLVAEDIGVHQMERLVEMLTSKECKDLLFALSHPEENIFKRLKRLSPEQNPLDLKPRAKRDASPAAGQCTRHLKHTVGTSDQLEIACWCAHNTFLK